MVGLLGMLLGPAYEVCSGVCVCVCVCVCVYRGGGSEGERRDFEGVMKYFSQILVFMKYF